MHAADRAVITCRGGGCRRSKWLRGGACGYVPGPLSDFTTRSSRTSRPRSVLRPPPRSQTIAESAHGDSAVSRRFGIVRMAQHGLSPGGTQADRPLTSHGLWPHYAHSSFEKLARAAGPQPFGRVAYQRTILTALRAAGLGMKFAAVRTSWPTSTGAGTTVEVSVGRPGCSSHVRRTSRITEPPDWSGAQLRDG